MNRTLRCVGLLVGLNVLATCGESTDQQTSTAAKPGSDDRCPTDAYSNAYPSTIPVPPTHSPEPTTMEREYARSSGINGIVSRSELGIIATIQDVSPMRWNTPDGEAWTRSVGVGETATQFRVATAKVEGVLFAGPEEVSVKPGDEVTVRMWGSGRPTGDLLEFPNRDGSTTPIYEDQMGGPDGPGDRVVWLLGPSRLQFSDCTVDQRLQLAGSFDGAWRVEGDATAPMARSLDPVRDVPLDALIARIDEERRAGKRPERDQADQRLGNR